MIIYKRETTYVNKHIKRRCHIYKDVNSNKRLYIKEQFVEFKLSPCSINYVSENFCWVSKKMSQNWYQAVLIK